MSHEQIQQIVKRLEEQNKQSAEQNALSEKRAEAQYKVWQDIRGEIERLHSKIDEVQSKQEPMYAIFRSVTGFNQIAVWILKALIMFGAGVGVLYGFIQYLKK